MSAPVGTKHLTKPGKHGTLYRYRIRYNDNPAFGPLTEADSDWGCWAYDAKQAVEEFVEGRDDGFVPTAWALLVVSQDGLTTVPHLMTWHPL